MDKGKEFLFEEDARNKLCSGIQQVADVIAVTLGPKGGNVSLQTSFGSPIISRDGNSIAKEIELKDPFENLGALLAREVSSKIKEKLGDGTTTGILLLKSLVQTGLKQIAAGANPLSIKKGLDLGLISLYKIIDSMAFSIKKSDDTKNIATVSASGDAEIGAIISECFEKVGRDGVIAIEEGKSTQTEIFWVQGLELDRGYVSSYFCTNAEKLIVEMNEAHVLITDKKIQSAQEILPLLQQVSSTGKELLIIADDIDGDALSTLVLNKMRGTLKVAAIKAPAFGDRKKAILEDLAILTGAQVVSEETGLHLKDADTAVLGQAGQIVISKEKTTIVDGRGDSKEIKLRIAQLDAQIKKASSQYEKEDLQKRKAKLVGGAALIRVGAPTESELKRKKQIFEDSLHSTRAALDEGIVPGGGIALLRSSKRLLDEKFEKEEQIGVHVLLRACEAPLRQIVANSGYDASVILNEVLLKDDSFGFNAISEKVEDLISAGVIDPVKVVKQSLAHAVSMAGVILLTDALIIDRKE